MVGCLAVSLASTLLDASGSLSSCDNKKCLQTLSDVPLLGRRGESMLVEASGPKAG